MFCFGTANGWTVYTGSVSNRDVFINAFNLCIVIDIDKKLFWIAGGYILSNNKTILGLG